MFGKKSREIVRLTDELASTQNKLEIFRVNMVALTEQVAKLTKENQALEHELKAAQARLREIQDKSNARTRKCRAKKKAQK